MLKMMKSNNIHYLLEVFWLIMAILLIVIGLFNLYKDGFDASYMFFIMAFLAALLYLARRYLRKKPNNAD